MDIITRGIPPEERIHNGTCSNCRTTVRFKQKEGTVTDDQRDGAYVTVVCPVCGHDISSSLKSARDDAARYTDWRDR